MKIIHPTMKVFSTNRLTMSRELGFVLYRYLTPEGWENISLEKIVKTQANINLA